MKRGMTIAAAALAVLVASEAPAHAAPEIQISEVTQRNANSGRAHFGGRLTFRDNRQGIDLYGSVTDQCEADGYGAYLRVTVHFGNGSSNTWAYQDTNGCGGHGAMVSIHDNFGRRVTKLSFHMYEHDADTGVRGDERRWTVHSNA